MYYNYCNTIVLLALYNVLNLIINTLEHMRVQNVIPATDSLKLSLSFSGMTQLLSHNSENRGTYFNEPIFAY